MMHSRYVKFKVMTVILVMLMIGTLWVLQATALQSLLVVSVVAAALVVFLFMALDTCIENHLATQKRVQEVTAHRDVLSRRHDLLLANLTYAYEEYNPSLGALSSGDDDRLVPVVVFESPVGRILVPFAPENGELFSGLPSNTEFRTESMADYHASMHRLEAMKYQ